MRIPEGLKPMERFIRSHALASALIAALALAFALGLYAFRGALFLPASEEITDNRPPRAIPGVPTLRHPLTGYPVETAVPIPQVYGVMIDHMVDAWPQSGVDKAFLVIEAPVEAGIPRLLAFYTAENSVTKIGPIRSARPYFIDWANELDAFYTHVGGSDVALKKLATNPVFNFDQYFHGASFWRSADRFAPHNVYTSVDLLAAAAKEARANGKLVDPAYGLWMFKDGTVLTPDPGVSPSFEFSSPSYRVMWSYDPKTDQYTRHQAGLPYEMQDGSDVVVDNVVAVVTNISTIDQVGHREVRTLGQGDAIVFRDGQAIQAIWKKPTAEDRIRFYDSNGEVQMNAGHTWIEVIPGRESVKF